ncbi:helix-turn-helix transcriptional regulator [Streptomyces sp. NPDC026092]|uniref:helix-turn-helix domain-containing protein n=1 Tax=Streptomyces sp. NPDC026092 TaxID=3154797 RepID=UPI0033C9552A
MEEAHEDPLAELALRLRTLRAQRGLQMGALQLRTGLGRTTISQALNGNKVPSEATVVALGGALGSDVGPLLALRRAAARVPQARKESRGKAPRYPAADEWQREKLLKMCSDFTAAAADAARHYLEALTPICREDWELAEAKVAALDMSSLRLARQVLELGAPKEVVAAASKVDKLLDVNTLRQAIFHREAPEGEFGYLMLMLLAVDNRQSEFVAAARKYLHDEEGGTT